MPERTVSVPPVHLWVYNHFFSGISDQVGFIFKVLKQQGYVVTIGRRPSSSSLNIVIENFSAKNRDILIEFCRSNKKRVAMILTEHLDLQHGRLFFHGAPLGSETDYLHPMTVRSRVQHLLECLPFVRCFFVLGDLPELQNISTMLPDMPVRSIPFPKLDEPAIHDVAAVSRGMADLVFTGAMTAYRLQVLSLLNTAGLSLTCPKAFISRHRRNAMNRSAKVIVNIPQREGWRWLSLMRIIAGLQTGRPTISLGTSDRSHIASCCTQLDMGNEGWLSEVRRCTDDWESMYIRDIVNYSLMARAFEQKNPFPRDIFEYWSLTEKVQV